MSDSTLPPGPPQSEADAPQFPPDYLLAYLEEPQGSAREEFEQLSPIRRFLRRLLGV